MNELTEQTIDIRLPVKGQGRRNETQEAEYQRQLELFCEGIKDVKSRLDFSVSSRGWCYLLEEYGLKKGDFDKAQLIINDCRKSGLLPLDICATDEARVADGIEKLDDKNINRYASGWVNYIRNDIAGNYEPYSFFDYQNYYIEMLVEKIDLKGIFAPVCEEYHIPYANNRGWADINGRASLMRRFKTWERKGKECVLLYCGDHDPGGLNISDSIRSNLADISGAVNWSPDNLIIERFGLNHEFIEANNLTWIENLITGSGNDLADPHNKEGKKDYVQNYLKQFGARKVEANALVTRVEAGRKLCSDAIIKYIDFEGIDNYNNAISEAQNLLQTEIKNLMK